MKHILPLFFLSAAVIAAPQIAPTTFPTKDVPIVDRIFNPPPPDQDASPALQAVIDELATKLNEAQQLLAFCKDKLTKAEEEVKRLLEDDERNDEG